MSSRPIPPRLLVAKDESLGAEDLREQLTKMGYEVCTVVDTAEDAVAQARALQPDLVLLDIRLRGRLDGIHAAAQLCHEAKVPVVFLTAHADQATLDRDGITEPLGYVLKPFETRELKAAIEMALHRHQAETRLRKMERWLATTLQSIGDGVIATDEQGRVTFINAVAESITDWSRREAI